MKRVKRLNSSVAAAWLALLLVAAQAAVPVATRTQKSQPAKRGAARRTKYPVPYPGFTQYSVYDFYGGPPAPVVLRTRKDRTYRTRLAEDSRGEPNFAGHYRVVWWGCGTGCAQMSVVDARTGLVYWLPLEYIDIPDPDLDEEMRRGFQIDSRLLVVTRTHYDRERTYTAYYYVFERNRFRLVRRAERKLQPRPEADPQNDNTD